MDAATSPFNEDPGTGLKTETAWEGGFHLDSFSHIRLRIVSGCSRLAPTCRLATNCHNVGKSWAWRQRSGDISASRFTGSVSFKSDRIRKSWAWCASLTDLMRYNT